MELVPFNNSWADSGCKLDLRGIYQATREGDTRISSLPIRRHNDWDAKGLRYVTLASGEDIAQVRDSLRANGVNLDELAKSYEPTGVRAFRVSAYLAEQPQREAREVETIKARLAQIEKPRKGAAA